MPRDAHILTISGCEQTYSRACRDSGPRLPCAGFCSERLRAVDDDLTGKPEGLARYGVLCRGPSCLDLESRIERKEPRDGGVCE